jgi:hypothetical protein
MAPFLRSTELRSEVHAYLTGTLRGLECDLLQVGGVEDHVHILTGLSRKIWAELVLTPAAMTSPILASFKRRRSLPRPRRSFSERR